MPDTKKIDFRAIQGYPNGNGVWRDAFKWAAGALAAVITFLTVTFGFSRITTLEGKHAEVEKRVERIDQKLDDIKSSVDRIEKKVDR